MSTPRFDRRTMLALCGGVLTAPPLTGCLGRETGYEEWRDVDRIVLDTYTDHWEGVAPEMINGEIDPVLVLLENHEYELIWRNADGDPHTIAICDGAGDIVENYVSESTEQGQRQKLHVVATQGIESYACETRGEVTFAPIELYEESDTSLPATEEALL